LQIAEASAEYIARPIASGGLSNQKAKAIRNLLDMIVARFGAPTLKPLRAMSDEEAEYFLLSLPGVGEENGEMHFDVFAGQAGLSGGHALLAHRQAFRLGQADTEGQTLRAARYG
jgi:endonuclease III